MLLLMGPTLFMCYFVKHSLVEHLQSPKSHSIYFYLTMHLTKINFPYFDIVQQLSQITLFKYLTRGASHLDLSFHPVLS
jgi:hypothetical protein